VVRNRGRFIFNWSHIVSGYNDERLLFLRKYIALRQALASRLRPTSTSPSDGTNTEVSPREMLSHVAWLSEEIMHASEEKVNLAQSSYESVSKFGISRFPLVQSYKT
jgi:hypothetical protein